MGGSVLRARLSCWGRHSLGLATWISCFTPVAGGFFLETWNPVLFKNKQEKSLSLLLAVCLGYWDTIGLSAWKWGLFKHSSKEKCFEPTVELPLGALLKGTYVTVTPGLPQYPTRPDMLKSAEAHRGKSLLSAALVESQVIPSGGQACHIHPCLDCPFCSEKACILPPGPRSALRPTFRPSVRSVLLKSEVLWDILQLMGIIIQ